MNQLSIISHIMTIVRLEWTENGARVKRSKIRSMPFM